MAIRWIVCPVIRVTPVDAESGLPMEPYQMPLVGTLVDAATGQPYPFSAAVADDGRALCFVRGVNWTAINNNSQCYNVLKRDYEDAEGLLDSTPRRDGWNTTRWNTFVSGVTGAGYTVTGLTRDSTFRHILNHIGTQVNPSFNVDQTWAL